MIYAARFEAMNALLTYLTENCCGGTNTCAPPLCAPPKTVRRRQKVTA
jgi:hypothetical protein